MGFGSGTSQAPVIKPVGASCALGCDVMSGWPLCVDVNMVSECIVVCCRQSVSSSSLSRPYLGCLSFTACVSSSRER